VAAKCWGDTLSDLESGGLSRRTLMKRGAVVGGAVVWATPVVQSLTTPAFAGTPTDPGCPETHEFVRLKLEVNDDGTVSVSNGPIGHGGTQCDWDEYDAAPGGDTSHVISTVVLEGGLCMKITFDDDCDAKLATAMVKSGSKEGFCVEDPNTDVVTDNTLKVCISRQQISHILILVCCKIDHH
jgi:hypothetical protein